MRLASSLAAALLSLLLVFAACSDRDCSDLTCQCVSTEDCPTPFGCGPDNLCYPTGSYPLNTFCSDSSQCASTACQAGLGFCVQKCGFAGADPCPEATRCQGNECLPLHSLPVGSTCQYDDLCPTGAYCIGNNCAFRCTNGYSASDCPDDGTYCQVADEPSCVVPQPDCVPGGANTCPTPRVCVDVGRGLGICRQPCATDFSAGTYDDTCPAQVGYYVATCAPIGVAGTTACIESAAAGGQNGALCNNGSRLCGRGFVCVSGACRQVCEDTSHCTTGTCTPTLNGFPVCL